MKKNNMLRRLTKNYNTEENSNIYKLFTIISEQIEELKHLLEKEEHAHGIKNAEGKQLDLIGEDVLQARYGMTDEGYRALLRFKNSINISGTDINSVNNAMHNITQNNYLGLYENKNGESASVTIRLKTYDEHINYNMVEEILAAGVSASFISERENKSKTYIATLDLTGENITVFPYNVGELTNKNKINVAPGYAAILEQTTIKP